MHNPMETLALVKKLADVMAEAKVDLKTSVTALSMCLAFALSEIDTEAEKKQARAYIDEVIDHAGETIQAAESRWGAFLKEIMAA